jgi:serine/threonine protein kinase
MEGTEMIVKIADFGLARALSDGHYFTSLVMTSPYRAPELLFCDANQIQLAYDFKIDVWAVAALFMELIVGEYVFYRKKSNYKDITPFVVCEVSKYVSLGKHRPGYVLSPCFGKSIYIVPFS